MIIRQQPDGARFGIPQPSHAWVSAQLALAWGNEAFGRFEPADEVVLAATQHDIGWIAWEERPRYNPATRLPFSFMELPTRDHLTIWRSAGAALLSQSRYAALLVSLHGTGLYERLHDYSRDTPEEVEEVRRFLESERGFQAELTGWLRGDREWARYAEPAVLDRNRRLLATWDAFSLMLCFGRLGAQTLSGVPAREGMVNLSVEGVDGAGREFRVAPWPFQSRRVEVRCEGWRLREGYQDEAEMQASLGRAGAEALAMRLTPG